MKNTTEVCLAAGGVKPPKSPIRLCHHGFASANIVTAPTVVTLSILSGSFLLEHLAHAVHIVRWRDAKGEFEATDES